MKKQFFLIFLLSIVAIMITTSFLSVANYSLEAFTVELETKVSLESGTVIVIPPLGEIKGATHVFPVQLIIKLSSVDLSDLRDFVVKHDKEAILEHLQQKLKSTLFIYIGRLLFLSIFCTGLLVFLWEKNIFVSLQSILVSFFLFVVILTAIALPYKVDAFKEPEFTGVLTEMPWFLRVMEEGLESYQSWETSFLTLTDNLSNYYQFVNEFKMAPPNEVGLRVLHVSDIHNNSLAVSLVANLIENFAIDFVIDTGDLTDFGTALELELTKGLKNLSVPYVFIPGNHDSPEVIASLNEIENIIVLNEGIFSYKGLRVLGLADPASSTKEFIPEKDLNLFLDQDYFSDDGFLEDVDILAIHNLAYGEDFLGRVPIILYGHNHQQAYNFKAGSHLVGAGSTGAEGLRGLQLSQEAPFAAVILNFDQDKELIVVDLLKFTALNFNFTVQRIFI